MKFNGRSNASLSLDQVLLRNGGIAHAPSLPLHFTVIRAFPNALLAIVGAQFRQFNDFKRKDLPQFRDNFFGRAPQLQVELR